MSAYDMSVRDSIYGKGDRYVSRKRLEAMLGHEYGLLLTSTPSFWTAPGTRRETSLSSRIPGRAMRA